jgi:hypothetical protein
MDAETLRFTTINEDEWAYIGDLVEVNRVQHNTTHTGIMKIVAGEPVVESLFFRIKLSQVQIVRIIQKK